MAKYLVAFCCFFCCISLASAQSPKKFKAPDLKDILPLLNASSPDALEGVLRAALLQQLPNPLFQKDDNWGRQRMVANGVTWKRKGILLKPTIQKKAKNDGIWRRYILYSNNLPDTLILDIRNVRFPEPFRMQFDVYIAFDGRGEYIHHVWESGVRLYAGSVRARFRNKLTLSCEASASFAASETSYWPDAVFNLKVHQAHVAYDNLVVEHVPGIGGAAAQIIGQAFHGAVREWQPSLEQGLLERANQAILRAGRSREVRVSLSRIFSKAFPNR